MDTEKMTSTTISSRPTILFQPDFQQNRRDATSVIPSRIIVFDRTESCHNTQKMGVARYIRYSAAYHPTIKLLILTTLSTTSRPKSKRRSSRGHVGGHNVYLPRLCLQAPPSSSKIFFPVPIRRAINLPERISSAAFLSHRSTNG